MLSLRTSCDSFLSNIARRHRDFEKFLLEGSLGASSLALRHPAFSCEIKMDGERMLVHIKRGIVTMQVNASFVWLIVFANLTLYFFHDFHEFHRIVLTLHFDTEFVVIDEK